MHPIILIVQKERYITRYVILCFLITIPKFVHIDRWGYNLQVDST
jgi:hypothetical protein